MPTIDLIVESQISESVRAEQVSSMFDVPRQSKARLEWRGEIPIEDRDWNVGLIVGPSGSGKSTILNNTFGRPAEFDWLGKSVIDDFDKKQTVEKIADICQAVGFNTIPAWLRPYGVLSTGEKFRVDLARRLLEGGALVTCDEFTSVVDRQVARIGSYAVQKFVRKNKRQFVAAACHYDLEEWLQPDWVFEPAIMRFRWRSVQRRPPVDCAVARVPYKLWRLFAPFHYLTASLHPSARCFALFHQDRPVAFCGLLKRPHPLVKDIWGVSRTVTLPDFQGMGFASVLTGAVASAYKAHDARVRVYPAHPALIRIRQRSPDWNMVKAPGASGRNRGPNSSIDALGTRHCAIFEYCGPAMEDREQAERLLRGNDDLAKRPVLV